MAITLDYAMMEELTTCCRGEADVADVIVRTIIALSFAQSSDDVSNTVKRAARDLVSADGSAFVLMDGDACFYADEDAVAPLWKGKRFPKEACISGWCMVNKQQVAITDIYQDERIPHDAYRPTFVKSLVMTPVRKDAPIAAIGTYWAHHHEASRHQEELLQALADITAVAVQNIEQKQNLEQLVEKRTDELAASRDELKRLAYIVSHELQEPLRAMSSDLRLLSVRYNDKLGDDAHKFILDALNNGTRVERMLDALWMFARIDKSSTSTTSVSSEEALDKALNRLSTVIGAREAKVTHTSLPVVRTNPAQLEYLFQELVENAIKFCRETPLIHISCQRRDTEWVFSVEDNGNGFDMIEANAIFTMFNRLEKGQPGTGMGLTVCRRIVESHGGSMWTKSQPNRGSTFYFTLPA